MEDEWSGAARRGSALDSPPAVRRSTRGSVPWQASPKPENPVRFLLSTKDEPLALALQSGLAHAGHESLWLVDLPPPDAAADNDVLLIDAALPGTAPSAAVETLRAAGVRAAILLVGDGDARASGVAFTDRSAGAEAVLGALLALAKPALAASERRWLDGELAVDTARQTARLNGVPVELTPLEWQVIALLASQPDRAVPRAEVARLIGGGDSEASDNAVAVHLYNLRRKLGRHAIQTIRGRGFRLRP
jgi:DNA-binding response OmpR family regulator